MLLDEYARITTESHEEASTEHENVQELLETA
jgi:hypothetical protein